MSTHYSLGQKTLQLDKWASKQAAKLVKIKGYPILCYTGMSGSAHATALSLALYRLQGNKQKFGMIYVRKANEKSHGQDIEHTKKSDIIKRTSFGVFVDDLICEGKTFRKVKNKVLNNFGLSISLLCLYDKEDATNCVGIPVI